MLALGMLTALRRCLDLVAAAPGWRASPKGWQGDAIRRPTLDRRVPGRIARPDDHAATSQAAQFLRPGGRGGHHAPGPIPGRHGPPYLRGARSGTPACPSRCPRPESDMCSKRPWGADLPGTGHAAGDGRRRLLPGGQTSCVARWAWRRQGELGTISAQLVRGMLERGYSPLFAQPDLPPDQGFATYGFPESHAASFALLVYFQPG